MATHRAWAADTVMVATALHHVRAASDDAAEQMRLAVRRARTCNGFVVEFDRARRRALSRRARQDLRAQRDQKRCWRNAWMAAARHIRAGAPARHGRAEVVS